MIDMKPEALVLIMAAAYLAGALMSGYAFSPLLSRDAPGKQGAGTVGTGGNMGFLTRLWWRFRVWAGESIVPALSRGDLARLMALYRVLPAQERRLLDHIATRLHSIGCRKYGPLEQAGDKRDWRKEGQEELYDAFVYEALGEMRVQSRGTLRPSAANATPEKTRAANATT